MNDPHLKQDKLFHDNRVIYRFYSSKAMVVIQLHHHYHHRNFLMHVLEKQTNTRRKKKRFSMETGKEYSYSKI
jgi:hypothetical protein